MGNTVQVKPRPDVYTVLVLVAILVLVVAIAVVLNTLMSSLPNGYGLKFSDLLAPLNAGA